MVHANIHGVLSTNNIHVPLTYFVIYFSISADAEYRVVFLNYFTERYRFSPFITEGKTKKYIGYDNMCNLVRSLEKVKDKHPKLMELATSVIKVVDKFHFRSHVGEFCKKHVNPHMWQELDDTNMSVAEQAF